MGHELRRVPVGWKHPRDHNGNYKPLYDVTYRQRCEEFIQRMEALLPVGEINEDIMGEIEDAASIASDLVRCRPEWPEDAIMGYCVYENVSEGTPVSPVFETLQEVLNWLIGEYDVPPESAVKFIEWGHAPSFMMYDSGDVQRGIDAL